MDSAVARALTMARAAEARYPEQGFRVDIALLELILCPASGNWRAARALLDKFYGRAEREGRAA